MNEDEIRVMITLIEGEYSRDQRNTPDKMRHLILKEFDVSISPDTILKITGIDEDFELENRRIECGGFNNY